MKIDSNDRLFSVLKRKGHTKCQRCTNSNLQACHIFGRRYYSTRFDPFNAIVLCYACHHWFDTHKISACLWDESKRVFAPDEESYHFLVSIGYTWEGIIELYLKSRVPFRGYKAKKKEIAEELNRLLVL